VLGTCGPIDFKKNGESLYFFMLNSDRAYSIREYVFKEEVVKKLVDLKDFVISFALDSHGDIWYCTRYAVKKIEVAQNFNIVDICGSTSQGFNDAANELGESITCFAYCRFF
jgi:hypothetical protein